MREFVVDLCHQTLFVIKVAWIYPIIAVRIAKIGRKGISANFRISATFLKIIHINRYTAMIHKSSYQLPVVFWSVCTAISILQLIQMVFRIAEVCRQCLIIPYVRMAASAFLWMFVVIHNLSHGRCHTTCFHLFVPCSRTEFIIWCKLSPL